jgi:hypothetical protein
MFVNTVLCSYHHGPTNRSMSRIFGRNNIMTSVCSKTLYFGDPKCHKEPANVLCAGLSNFIISSLPASCCSFLQQCAYKYHQVLKPYHFFCSLLLLTLWVLKGYWRTTMLFVPRDANKITPKIWISLPLWSITPPHSFSSKDFIRKSWCSFPATDCQTSHTIQLAPFFLIMTSPHPWSSKFPITKFWCCSSPAMRL